MVVQDTSCGRVGVEGPIKGVMGRCAQAQTPRRHQGPPTATRGGHSPAPAHRWSWLSFSSSNPKMNRPTACIYLLGRTT